MDFGCGEGGAGSVGSDGGGCVNVRAAYTLLYALLLSNFKNWIFNFSSHLFDDFRLHLHELPMQCWVHLLIFF